MKAKISDCQHRLKYICELREITQKDLAIKAGIRESSISNYVNGKSTPNHEIICKLADTLDVTTDWLLGYGKDKDVDEITFEKLLIKKYREADWGIKDIIHELLDLHPVRGFVGGCQTTISEEQLLEALDKKD